jgi:hypothetical protein
MRDGTGRPGKSSDFRPILRKKRNGQQVVKRLARLLLNVEMELNSV